MAENEEGQEKTEDPTSKRLSDARNEGQVPRSNEVNNTTILLASALMLYFLGSYMLANFDLMLVKYLRNIGLPVTPSSVQGLFMDLIIFFIKTALPMLLGILIIGIATSVAQVGFNISLKALTPKWSKLNIFSMKNIQNALFSSRQILELLKATVKIFIVFLFTYPVITSHMPTIIKLAGASLPDMGILTFKMIIEIIIRAAVVMLVIAIFDLTYQRWKHHEDLKMTKQEVKDERKNEEGDPEVKQKIRSKQNEAFRKRMMEGVKNADVVITNPTHYAVALQYITGQDKAPRVVAKGERLLALRIKELAKDYGVLIYEDPPLARALYATVDIDEEIPENLYKAVAEILSLAYASKR